MVVTDKGKDDVRSILLNQIAKTYKYFGVGTDATPADNTQTDLVAPIEVYQGSRVYRKEVDAVYWDGQNIVFICRLLSGEFNIIGQNVYIREVGIFNAVEGGIMLVREILDQPLVKNQDKEYVIAVKVQLFG